MIIARLVVDSGCIISGVFDTLGSACAKLSRSCTSCRARMRLVPGSNTRSIAESPVIELDRIALSQETLVRISSRLRVTRSSTSAAESPSASVWI